MKTIRILFVLFAYIFINTCAYGAKAIHEPFIVNQPDGTRLTVVLRGDEYFHWYATTDGVLLYPTDQHFVIADVQANGTLQPTRHIAHNSPARSSEEIAVAIKQNRQAFYQLAEKRLRQLARRREPLGQGTYFPHTGRPKAILILVEYQDVKFTVRDPKKSFNLMFNSMETLEDLGNREDRNLGSVSRYFYDMSFGTYQPEFEVYGPVTVPNDMKYYGGSNPNSTSDEKSTDLVKDALQLVGDEIDFTDPSYDSNGDGKIDLIYIVYAGYGQNSGGPAESIWAKAGYLSGTVNGVPLSRYCMACELNRNEAYWTSRNQAPQINGVGVNCHEFSHTMGLPDIYPTTSSAYADNQEMEYWDLMDGGSYVYNGYRPTAYTAWEREVFGWMTIETLDESQQVELTPVLEGGTAYRINNPAQPKEYFVVENVQNRSWNLSLVGHGMLVYHVNYPSDVVNMGDHPNNTAGRPGLALVPADGTLASSYLIGKETSWGTDVKTDDNGNIISEHIATTLDYQQQHYGDPFPGSTAVTELTSSQGLPNYCWYSNDSQVQCALYNITEDVETGTVSFYYSKDGTNGISDSPISTNRQSMSLYTLDGRRIDTQATLQPGIYVSKGRKVIKR